MGVDSLCTIRWVSSEIGGIWCSSVSLFTLAILVTWVDFTDLVIFEKWVSFLNGLPAI